MLDFDQQPLESTEHFKNCKCCLMSLSLPELLFSMSQMCQLISFFLDAWLLSLFFLEYLISEIPDDSENKSGMDRVLPKIIGSGRVSGTRQSLPGTLMWSQVLWDVTLKCLPGDLGPHLVETCHLICQQYQTWMQEQPSHLRVAMTPWQSYHQCFCEPCALCAAELDCAAFAINIVLWPRVIKASFWNITPMKVHLLNK